MLLCFSYWIVNVTHADCYNMCFEKSTITDTECVTLTVFPAEGQASLTVHCFTMSEAVFDHHSVFLPTLLQVVFEMMVESY